MVYQPEVIKARQIYDTIMSMVGGMVTSPMKTQEQLNIPANEESVVVYD